MKRILALSLAAVLSLFMLAGCGSSEAVELFKKAQKNMGQAENIELSGCNISIGTGGEQAQDIMDISFSLHMIPDKADMFASQLQASAKTAVMGESTETNIWYRDNTLYLESDGVKGREALNDELRDAVENLSKGNTDIDIADYVTDSKMDGNVVTLKVDGEKILRDSMKKMASDSDMKENLQGYDDMLKIKDTTVTAEIVDETMKSLKYVMTMEMDMGDGVTDSAASYVSNMTVTIDIGEIKTDKDNEIKYPDLTGFPEIPTAVGEDADAI